MWRVLALTGAILGCGSEGGETDAATQLDGSIDMASVCKPKFGRTFVFDLLQFLPKTEGYDLNGDGTIDNVFGDLGAQINDSFTSDVAQGRTLLLFDMLLGAGAPPFVPGAGFDSFLFAGLDADDPPDPANNLGGAGRFLVPLGQFDVSCKPTSSIAAVPDSAQTLKLTAKRLLFNLISVGTLEFSDLRGDVTFSADHTRMEKSKMGGVMKACTLSVTPAPGIAGSLLDIVTGFMIKPDIDRDGDGLETVEATGGGKTINRCVDGDGTVISGIDCPCDPRIQDGYSTAIQFSGAPASIIGLATPQ